MRVPRLKRWDLLPPAFVGAVGLVEITAAGHEPVWVGLMTYTLAALVLYAGRSAPLAVPLVVTGIYATTPLLGFDVSQPASWLVLIAFACFGTGLHAPRSHRPAGLASVVGGAALAYAGLAWLTDFEPSVLFGLIVSVGPWGLGIALQEALDQNRRAGAAAERARADRALAGRRAADSERERIAVELHDTLAHSLGAMVVQSSVARDRVQADPATAAVVIDEVAQAGREALAETGRLLRLLRDDRDELGLRREASPEAPETTPGAPAPPAVQLRDALLPAFLGLVGTAEVVSLGGGAVWTSVAAYWLAVGALCARRAFPSAMPITVTSIFLGAGLAGLPTDELASWIAIAALAYFAAGRHAPRSRVAWSLASVLVSIALLALDAMARRELTADVVLVLAFAAGPWLVGVALREALERARALAVEAERMRVEQELEAERSAAAERKRIARELHDVLATSLGVMVVQASVAADLVVSDPSEAIAAVSEVERAGRAALGETGRLLRLIHGTNEPGTHPQHGIADLPTLAEEYARAGLGVEVDADDVIPLPIGIDLSTYRIVQEALTNALKHAPGSRVRVRLERRGYELMIEVRNGPATSARVAAMPSGHGLVGLRERVSFFGGSLDTRRTPDGGFVLAATIPVSPEALGVEAS